MRRAAASPSSSSVSRKSTVSPATSATFETTYAPSSQWSPSSRPTAPVSSGYSGKNAALPSSGA